ncbi:MAG: hypothetical protein AAF702_23185 [Chloroflexota bacterium]
MLNKKLSWLITAVILVIAVAGIAAAQMGIGTTNPDPSAAVDIVSTTQGVLHPRLTTAERDAINGGTFAEGLTIYNTTDKCLQVWDGTSWNCIVGGSSPAATGFGTGMISITPSRYFSQGAFDQQWIDDDTFVLVEGNFNPNANPENFVYANEQIVKVFNANWAEIERFTLGDPGPLTPGTLYHAIHVVPLNNGNLMFYATAPNTVARRYKITQQDGTVVKAWADVPSFSAVAVQTDHMKLDNGNIVFWDNTSASITEYVILDEDGNQVNFFTSGANLFTHDIAATTFGFVALASNWSSNTNLYNFYDSDGTFSTQTSVQTNASAPFFWPSTGVTSAHIDMARVGSSDTFYIGMRRLRAGMSDQPSYHELGRGIPASDEYYAGLRKVTMDSAGTVNTLGEIEIDPELPEPLFGSEWGTVKHPWDTMTAFPDGRLLATGAAEPDILAQPITARYASQAVGATSLILNDMGRSFQIHQFNADGTHNGRIRLIPEEGAQSPGGLLRFNAPLIDTRQLSHSPYAAEHSVLHLSPSGTSLFVGYWVSSANSDHFHDYQTIYAMLDPATMTERPVQLLANGQPQDIRKNIGVFEPQNRITKVEISIIDGAGANDALQCPGCIGDVSSSYNSGSKTLILTHAGGDIVSADLSAAMREITMEPDSVAGTRTLQVELFTGLGETTTRTFQIEVVDP